MHTARISTIKVIISSDKWIKMMNFKLGNEMWKVDDRSVEQRTKNKFQFLSQTGIEPTTSWRPGGRCIHWAARTHGGLNYLTDPSSMRDYCHIWTQLVDLLSSHNSLDRVPSDVQEVMGSIPVSIFLCPTLVSCWSNPLAQFNTELNIHPLYSIIIISLQ